IKAAILPVVGIMKVIHHQGDVAPAATVLRDHSLDKTNRAGLDAGNAGSQVYQRRGLRSFHRAKLDDALAVQGTSRIQFWEKFAKIILSEIVIGELGKVIDCVGERSLSLVNRGERQRQLLNAQHLCSKPFLERPDNTPIILRDRQLAKNDR